MLSTISADCCGWVTVVLVGRPNVSVPSFVPPDTAMCPAWSYAYMVSTPRGSMADVMSSMAS